MSTPDLRLFPSSAAAAAPGEVPPVQASVCVRVGQIVPLLLAAAAADRAWLGDFVDDPLMVSQDLYEVLLAYQRQYEHDAPASEFSRTRRSG